MPILPVARLTTQQRETIFRQRYIYRWQVPQIVAWWKDRAVQLLEFEVAELVDTPPASILAEVRERMDRDRQLTERRHVRKWRADRQSIEALLCLLGPAAVRAAESENTKELRALVGTYAEAVQVAKDLPDDRRKRRGVRSDVLELSDEEIVRRWKDLV